MKSSELLNRTPRIYACLAGLVKFERDKARLFNITNEKGKHDHGYRKKQHR